VRAGAPPEAAREHPPSKDDVRQIVPREIGELVPGIVAHELKSLRQELQQDIEGIDDRLETLEALYSNLRRAKEIDGIRAEVRAIQKLLGIEKKIAA
jgi:chaperonin cofactor prefoldin